MLCLNMDCNLGESLFGLCRGQSSQASLSIQDSEAFLCIFTILIGL